MQKKKKIKKKMFAIGNTRGHSAPFYHKPKATSGFKTGGKKKAEWFSPHIDMSQTQSLKI